MAKNNNNSYSSSSSSSHANVVNASGGFCKSNSTFYSKRIPILLPSAHSLDITTFISSRPHQGNIAFIDAATNRHLTFSDVWRAVDSVSSSLSDIGIRKGNVVLILSPNSIFFPIVCLSVMSLGAIITTVNPLNTPREIAKQIADSKPVIAFTVPQLVLKLITESKSDIPIVLIGPNNIKLGGSRILTTLEKMMKKEPSQSRVRERVTQDDIASLLYSSGTTGDSKGVVSSHGNLIAMTQTIVNRYNLDAENLRFMCVLPMFHIYGLAAFVTGFLATGSTVVILPQFDLDNTLSAIDKYRVTHFPLVPPILLALLNGADQIKRKYELSSLKYVVCGGAPLSKEVTEGFVEKYPEVGILQVYGLTESPMGASTESLEESRRYGSSGMLSASMEGKIVDPETGKALPENQTGELWLRGPVVMKGYFNNAEATASTLDSDGWLKTGDLCFFDDDGFIFVVDRLKELIKYKGYQVPPAELEALLLTHPGIADAAVIPFPDREVGQYPMAYVVRKHGTDNVSDKDVMEFIAKQVAPYKRIRRVKFVDSIPKNPSGKILRKDLIKFATSTSKSKL